MTLCEWKQTETLVGYQEAQQAMEARVSAIQVGSAPEQVWLLEHPPLYTIGNRGNTGDILPSANLPVFETKRGGEVTYHGPGQRVAYIMIDLKARKPDIKWYVASLEEWLIQTLKHFGIQGERRPGRVGIWVVKEGHDHKIAALGVRIQRWVTSHGIALNVHPDLSAYNNIIPCGLSQYGVTSLADLGLSVSMNDVDAVLHQTYPFV